tara:strand:+ start:93 stop:575 length:483 start_codon:yes stop_codon:yes gene_type:complete
VSKIAQGGGEMKKVSKAELIMAVMVFSLSAMAYPYEKDCKHGDSKKGEKMQKFIDELGLSEEQQAQMKEQRQGHKDEIKEFYEEVRGLRDALKAELEKPDSNEATINSLATRLKALEGKKIDFRIQKVLELKSILTPEQFKKFKEKTSKWHEKKGSRNKE